MSDVTHKLAAQRQTRSGVWMLAGGVVGLSLVWGIVLPAVGQLPGVRSDIERVNAAGIDASALYWTDLEDDRLWARTTSSINTQHEVIH